MSAVLRLFAVAILGILFLLLVTSAGPLAPGAGPIADLPTASQLVAMVRRDHPRLLIPPSAESLRRELTGDPERNAMYRQVEAWASRVAGRAGSGRAPLVGGIGNLFETMAAMGLAYRVSGDRRYPQAAWRPLSGAAQRPNWNPQRFLGTAEAASAFAVAYDWFYDALTPDQRAVMRQAMIRNALQPAIDAYEGRAPQQVSHWTAKPGNWNLVSNAGIAMAALAIADEEPAVAGRALHAALESVRHGFSAYAPDGGWDEGPMYWRYGSLHAVVLVAALESALGTDLGLSGSPGFAETGWFPIYLTGPLGKTFNFSDARMDEMPHPPFMFWLARRFETPLFAAWAARNFSERRAAVMFFHPLWMEGRSREGVGGIPLARHFRGVEVATMRSAWEDPNAVFVGVKGGDQATQHNHLDRGSFVMDGWGQRWVVDPSGADYDLPRYFEILAGVRWTYYANRAEGHNTLVIGPGSGPDQDPRATARITRLVARPERTVALVDLGAVYPTAARAERGIALIDGRRVLVQDEVTTRGGADVWWFLHTQAAVELADGGRLARLSQGGRQLEARLLEPAGARFEVMDARPLPSSPHPAAEKPLAGVRKLAIHLPRVETTRIAVLLAAPGEPQEPVVPLARW